MALPVFTKVRAVIALATLLVWSGLALEVNGSQDQLYRFHPGLRFSKEKPFSSTQVKAMLKGLKSCTGFTDLFVNELDQIVPGDRDSFTQGSRVARELLIAAVESQDSFIVESINHSPLIAFAEIESTDTYIDPNNRRHAVWHLRMDLSDFAGLRGPTEAVASFAPALVLFHELAHGVLQKRDSLSATDQIGECEKHMNLIRRELGLPERERYQPRGWWAVSPGNSAESFQAEFSFSRVVPGKAQKQRFYLVFDVDRVCDVSLIQTLPPGRAEILLAAL